MKPTPDLEVVYDGEKHIFTVWTTPDNGVLYSLFIPHKIDQSPDPKDIDKNKLAMSVCRAILRLKENP